MIFSLARRFANRIKCIWYPYELAKTGVERHVDDESGLIYFVEYFEFIHRIDKSNRKLRRYITRKFTPSTEFEKAREESRSFISLSKNDRTHEQNPDVKKTHYNFKEHDSIKTGLWVYEYPDGSSYHEMSSYKTK